MNRLNRSAQLRSYSPGSAHEGGDTEASVQGWASDLRGVRTKVKRRLSAYCSLHNATLVPVTNYIRVTEELVTDEGFGALCIYMILLINAKKSRC